MGKQITVEQLIELSIVIRISRYDHVYRHHVRDKSLQQDGTFVTRTCVTTGPKKCYEGVE